MVGRVRFQVSTHRTGIKRVVRVVLHDTEDSLERAFVRRHPGEAFTTDGITTGAFFDLPATWEDRDPNPRVGGTIHLPPEPTMTLIAHEATHAAMHIYSIDGYRDHARASAHLNGHNEAVAYMVGDIAGGIGAWMLDHARRVDIGRPRDYGSPGHPWRLPRSMPL